MLILGGGNRISFNGTEIHKKNAFRHWDLAMGRGVGTRVAKGPRPLQLLEIPQKVPLSVEVKFPFCVLVNILQNVFLKKKLKIIYLFFSCISFNLDRIGGRLYPVSLKVKNGEKETFDLGGQWVCR